MRGHSDGPTVVLSMWMPLALSMIPPTLPLDAADVAAVSAPAPPTLPIIPAVKVPPAATTIMMPLLVVTAGQRAGESGESRSTPRTLGSVARARGARVAETMRVIVTRMRLSPKRSRVPSVAG